MNDDRTADLTASGDDEETREDVLDRFDTPVIAADATGMLAGERLITEGMIEESLEDSANES